jgi:hypothetical protein
MRQQKKWLERTDFIFIFQNSETHLFSQNNVKKNQSPQAIQEKSDSADFDLSPE